MYFTYQIYVTDILLNKTSKKISIDFLLKKNTPSSGRNVYGEALCYPIVLGFSVMWYSKLAWIFVSYVYKYCLTNDICRGLSVGTVIGYLILHG